MKYVQCREQKKKGVCPKIPEVMLIGKHPLCALYYAPILLLSMMHGAISAMHRVCIGAG